MVRKYCRLIFFIAAIAALIIYLPDAWWLFKFIGRAFRPVLIAVFLALVFHTPINYITEKILKKLKNKKVAYALSLAVVYVLVLGVLAVGIYFLVPEIAASFKGFTGKLPEYIQELKNILSGVGIPPEKTDGILQKIRDKTVGAAGDTEGLLDKVKVTGATLLDVFFAVILSVYILLDRKHLISQIRRFSVAILPHKVFNTFDNTAKVGGVIFAKFLGGQVIESFLLFVLTFIGMLILKLPYAPLVSAVVFVSNLIPMLGAYIGGIVGFILIAFVSLKQAVIFVIFSIVLQQFENNVTYPKVVGNSLGLSGFWVMAAVLVGGSLFGFWGIILGVPLTAVVYKMVGFALKKNDKAEAFLPEILQPANEGGDDSAPQSGNK